VTDTPVAPDCPPGATTRKRTHNASQDKDNRNLPIQRWRPVVSSSTDPIDMALSAVGLAIEIRRVVSRSDGLS
jgi:hypothetical protein